MKRRTTLIVAAAIAILCPDSILAVDKTPQELILGKWESTDDKDKGTTIEFAKGGTFKVDFNAGGLSFIFKGAYKFADDKTLEFTMDDLNKKGEKKTEKLSIKSLTADKIVFFGVKGAESSLKRMIVAPPPVLPGFPKKGGFNENFPN